jgi:DNA polymerase III alpha subunit
MYFSGHMLDGFSKALADPSITQIHTLYETDEQGEYTLEDRTRVTVAGIVTAITAKTTKKDEKMAFFTLEDRGGEIECVAFPKICAKYASELRADAVLRVEGNLSVREDERPKMLVSAILPLQDDNAPPRVMTESEAKRPIQAPKEPRILYLRVPSMQDEAWRRAKIILDIFDGALPVSVYDTSKAAYEKQSVGFDLSPFTLNELIAILGRENVVLK